MRRPSVALIVLLLLVSIGYGRTWTASDGGQTVEARFVTVQFDKVWLLRNDGRVFGVAWPDLCQADREHVQTLIREKQAQGVPRTENPPGRIPYGPGRELCRLVNQAVDESSGLAASRSHPGFFWTHNDSGGDARAYLLDTRGRDLGSCELDGILAFDLEDTLSFSSDGKDYLVLCDVGNNGRAAGVQMLHIFEEPESDAERLGRSSKIRRGGQMRATARKPFSHSRWSLKSAQDAELRTDGSRENGVLNASVTQVQTIHYAYEDDHRDCEAVGIDPTSKTFLFVTKEKGPKCSVYSLPWPEVAPDKAVVARQIATLLLSNVTAMDVSPDGRRAIVLTYGDAFEFQRDGDESWSQALARQPRRIVVPERVQGESICYGADGESLYLTSEHLPTPLWMVPVLKRDGMVHAPVGTDDESRACSFAQEDLVIDCDFPGGNIVVERIEGDDVYLHQDLRDTSTWWFFWCFRVRGAGSRRLTFHFTNKNVFATYGPAASTDGGRNWNWLGTDDVKGTSFSYAFSSDNPKLRFCFTIPYVQQDLERFIADHQDDPHLRVRQLCTSRKGRDVKRLHVGQLNGEPAYRILVTARHHACESMASFALEAFLAAALDDTPEGHWYRENVEILAIPFVDKDGVEDGDQGKNRTPYDHNRDYKGQSIYPEVAAIRTLVPDWSEGKLDVAFDLHCPWIRGPHNEVIYMVGKSDPALWEQQVAFGKILQETQQGPLVYSADDNLPFGQAWNTAGNYGDRMSCSMWAAQQKGIRLATSFELPYANAAGRRVDAASARAFGRDLARAVRQYLEQ